MAEKLNEYRPEQEYHYHCVVSSVTTARELLGGSVVEQRSRHSSMRNLPPLELDRVPTLVIAEWRDVKRGINEARVAQGYKPIQQSVDFTMIFQDAMQGSRWNHLLGLTARDPDTFGLDTNDIKSDWDRLYNGYKQNTYYADLRRRHQQFGHSWAALEKYGQAHLATIYNASESWRIPIIRWRNFDPPANNPKFERRELLFTPYPWTEEGFQSIQEFLAPVTDGIDPTSHFDPIVGLGYLAYHSPEQRSEWPVSLALPDNLSYARSIGTTQTPLSYTVFHRTLAESPLLSAAERHLAEAA